MIIKENTDLGRNCVVKDLDGKVVSHIKEFDTQSRKAVIYAQIVYNDKSTKIAGINQHRQDNEVVTFECHLPNHKAYKKINETDPNTGVITKRFEEII